MSLELDRNGRRPTEGDSHLRGTREPDRQATDVRAPILVTVKISTGGRYPEDKWSTFIRRCAAALILSTDPFQIGDAVSTTSLNAEACHPIVWSRVYIVGR